MTTSAKQSKVQKKNRKKQQQRWIVCEWLWVCTSNSENLLQVIITIIIISLLNSYTFCHWYMYIHNIISFFCLSMSECEVRAKQNQYNAYRENDRMCVLCGGSIHAVKVGICLHFFFNSLLFVLCLSLSDPISSLLYFFSSFNSGVFHVLFFLFSSSLLRFFSKKN